MGDQIKTGARRPKGRVRVTSDHERTYGDFEIKRGHPFMSKCLAYIRASTDKQDLDTQRLELLEYARRQHLPIDDFVLP